MSNKEITFLALNRATHAVEILEKPYWLRDDVYVGKNLRTDKTTAAYAKDIFYYEGSVVDLLKEIRFGKGSYITLKDLESKENRTLSHTQEGHCTIWCPDVGYFHINFLFDRGIKLKKNTLVIYDEISDNYVVTTTYSKVTKGYYETKKPMGKSYESVRKAFKELGPSTIAEIAEFLGWEPNRVSARISELSKSGEVYKTGNRKSGYGINNHVWAIR